MDSLLEKVSKKLDKDTFTKIKTYIKEEGYELVNFTDEFDETIEDVCENSEAEGKDEEIKAAFKAALDGDDEKEEEKQESSKISKKDLITELINTRNKVDLTKTKDIKLLLNDVCPELWFEEEDNSVSALQKAIKLSLNTGDKQAISILSILASGFSRYAVYKENNAGKFINDVFTDVEIDKDMKDIFENAVYSFFKRLNKCMKVENIQYKINDDINDVAAAMINICNFFIQCKTSQNAPLQIDFWISANEILTEKNDGDDDDNGDLSGDDNDDKSKNLESVKRDFEIEGLLKKDSLKYILGSINDKTDNKRAMDGIFKDFLKQEKISDSRNKRFVGFYDLNKKNKKNLSFFIPGKKDKILKNYIPETFISNSKYYLKKNNVKIGASDGEKGYNMTLSLILLPNLLIKGYLYYLGGIMRFFPKDIIQILPKLFANKDKKAQVINDDNKAKVKALEKDFEDELYKEFFGDL